MSLPLKISSSKHVLNRCLLFFTICSFSLFLGCENPEKNEKTAGNEENRKISEMMGHLVIENLNAQHVNIDMNSFIKGLEDGKAGKAAPLSKEEFSQIFAEYWKKEFEQTSAENLKKAEKFLEENKNKPNVVSLNDGKVQYTVLSTGSGDTVQEENTPLILYEGKYQDGKVFDDTHVKGEPLPLSLSTTIPGFKTGVVGMKKGEKRRLFIHPELGYGTQGRLQPNALLVFDIEVVEVDHKKETPPEAKEGSEKAIQGEKEKAVQNEKQKAIKEDQKTKK